MLFVMMRTVPASTTSTLSTGAIRLPQGDLVAGFRTRSMENFTESAVKGSPLWKATPRRSFNSHVVSLTTRQDSARTPTIRPVSSTPTSFS